MSGIGHWPCIACSNAWNDDIFLGPTALRCAAEQAIELPFGNPVTFTGAALQAAAVPDSDVATAVGDESGPLQRARRRRDTRSLNTQHHRQKLLREQEII